MDVACGKTKNRARDDRVEQTIGIFTGDRHSEIKAQYLCGYDLASAQPVPSSVGSKSAQ